MSNYRYILDKGSRKFHCPNCSKKRFVRFVDQQTGEYMASKYGRCDREFSCGYFLNPYSDGVASDDNTWQSFERPEPQSTSYIEPELFKASLKGYAQNNFVQYLKTLFDADTVKDLVSRYHIGTSKYWKGATIFWQVDELHRVRTGKIMLYEANGHRKKADDYNYIQWVHSINEDHNFTLEQCLFGSHLVEYSDKPIAIVESEKTAIICSGYLPEFTWIATGAKYNLKPETCQLLAGHEVVLFPDLDAYEEWQKKAGDLSGLCSVSLSNYLHSVAGDEDKKQGYDLADYLTQYPVDEFRGISNHAPGEDSGLKSKCEADISAPFGMNPWTGEIFDKRGYPAEWDNIGEYAAAS